MMDPDKYWPKWILDLADGPSVEKTATSPKTEVSTECLANGCLVYKPDWNSRAPSRRVIEQLKSSAHPLAADPEPQTR